MKAVKFVLVFFALFISMYGSAFTFFQNDSLDERFYALTRTLISKYNSGDLKSVKSDIDELTYMLPEYNHNWNYSNAKHKINIVLGRIALKEGDTISAKKFLLESGNSVFYQFNGLSTTQFGSPQLQTFGPNMSLAKELLDAGETRVVLEFFAICRRFWTGQQLDQWEAQIKSGILPFFGANLYY